MLAKPFEQKREFEPFNPWLESHVQNMAGTIICSRKQRNMFDCAYMGADVSCCAMAVGIETCILHGLLTDVKWDVHMGYLENIPSPQGLRPSVVSPFNLNWCGGGGFMQGQYRRVGMKDISWGGLCCSNEHHVKLLKSLMFHVARGKNIGNVVNPRWQIIAGKTNMGHSDSAESQWAPNGRTNERIVTYVYCQHSVTVLS